MIEQERIEAIKQGVDLVGLIEARGVKLKKNGKGYKGHCPFHDDQKTPSFSVTPGKNLWQCFGCGKGGDVIRFVEIFDKVSFPEAVEKLTSEDRGQKTEDSKAVKKESGEEKPPAAAAGTKQPAPAAKSPKAGEPEKSELAVKEKKLLARVVAYYQHSLTTDRRGLDYLKARGISDHGAIKDFGAGFVNGTLREILPRDEEIIGSLTAIGILNGKGNEAFYNCVVFPLYDEHGAIVNLYGRSIEQDAGVSHLYLPGPRRGLVNRQAVKRSESILLAESIIDALTLYGQGFKNVIPCYGVNGLIDEHLFLFNRKIKEAYIVFDADEAGRKGAAAVAARLAEKEITCHIVELPAKDVNLYFQNHTPAEFEKLLAAANPESREQAEQVSAREQSLYREEEHGFTVGYGERQYQIKGIQRGDTQLKATIKVARDVAAASSPFELTTIDLYSARSRQWFAKLCAELLSCAEELIKEDLGRIVTLVEQWRPGEQKAVSPQASEEDKQKALGYLKNPQLFAELLADFETMGVTGEEINKLVGYLAASSRKLADPLSVLIQSRSAAGKSTLQDAVLSLIPEEDYIKYTRVTDQALFYKQEDSLAHKVLAIEEAEGMGGAAYSIRNIQSARKITVAATGKDPGTGKMRTEEYTVNGPVAVMITTTATDVDQETASRFIVLTIDESAEMTGAIHERQREAETLAGLIKVRRQQGVIAKHHAAQRLLKPLAVVNPFSKYLTYPSHSLRSRRDHKKYLGLIRAIAFIHQHQREVKSVEVEGKPVEYIEVTLSDIESANRLANVVLGQSLDELASPSRTLLAAISKMVRELAGENQALEEITFTRRQLRQYCGWSDWQVRTHIKQLEELEYVHARIGSWGKQYAYGLHYQGEVPEACEQRCYLDLTPVEKIRGLAANDPHFEGQGPDFEGSEVDREGASRPAKSPATPCG